MRLLRVRLLLCISAASASLISTSCTCTVARKLKFFQIGRSVSSFRYGIYRPKLNEQQIIIKGKHVAVWVCCCSPWGRLP
jgi:hypothetical protein